MAESVPRTAPSEPVDARDARAQPPEGPVPLQREAPARTAGGLPAVVSSIRHAFGEAGTIRGTRLLLALNQFDGFDCPGCAWPEPDGHRSTFEFCENGAKAVAEEGTAARIDPDFFARHSVAELSRQSDHWLGKQGRLTVPMALRPGATHYEPISWDEAFALVAREVNALARPDEAVFYTSGRTSNEAAFLYQLFVREFGTNNLPDCSNLCHESSGSGLGETIGIGKGTVTLADFDLADAIFVIGQNPGTNHPRMLTSLMQAKRRGCKIVHINPLPETGLMRVVNPNPQEYLSNPFAFPTKMLLNRGTKLSDLWLPVRINGDIAMFRGMMKEMLAEEDRRP